MKLMPASRAAWMIRIDSSWSDCPGAKHHRAEAKLANRDAGAPQRPVLHACSLRCLERAPPEVYTPPTLSNFGPRHPAAASTPETVPQEKRTSDESLPGYSARRGDHRKGIPCGTSSPTATRRPMMTGDDPQEVRLTGQPHPIRAGTFNGEPGWVAPILRAGEHAAQRVERSAVHAPRSLCGPNRP
jgi:hypothetical protein